jgi:hypothetical protein
MWITIKYFGLLNESINNDSIIMQSGSLEITSYHNNGQ